MKVGGAGPAVRYQNRLRQQKRPGWGEREENYVLDKSVTRGLPEAASSTESGA